MTKTYMLYTVPFDRAEHAEFFSYDEEDIEILAQFEAESVNDVWDYLAKTEDDELLYGILCPRGNPPAEELLERASLSPDEDEFPYENDNEECQTILRVARHEYPTGELLKKYADLRGSFYLVFVKEMLCKPFTIRYIDLKSSRIENNRTKNQP